MTTITNDDGDTVTRINVTRVFTYDVDLVVKQLREDNRVGDNDDLEITLDDVLEYIHNLAEDDFATPVNKLLYQDENGNNY
jgi:hypothetical protein